MPDRPATLRQAENGQAGERISAEADRIVASKVRDAA